MIPEGWQLKTILEIGNSYKDTVQTGPFGAQLHASDYVDKGIPIILIRNITDRGLDTNDIPKITPEDAFRLKRYALKENDIVFSRVGRVGSCFLAGKEQEGWIISGQTLRIRLPKEVIHHKYLFYALLGEQAQGFIRGTAIGSTRKSISTKILEDLPILIPPLPEQRKIAEILGTWDETITLIERLITAKQHRKKALMQQLLIGRWQFREFVRPEKTHEVKFDDIPTDWEVAAIEDISFLVTNGFVGTATPHYTEENDAITYIQGYNVRANKINLRDVTKVTREFSKQQAKSILQEGDMLTVQSGHIGTSAVVPHELVGANCHAVIITRFMKDKANPNFVAYYLNSSMGRKRLKAIEVGSSVLHINTKDLKKFKIPLPVLPEQCKIAAVLQACDEEIELLGQKLAVLKRQKQGLMQQLLTGRVRVKDEG